MSFLGHLKSLHLIHKYSHEHRTATQDHLEEGSDVIEDGELTSPAEGAESDAGTHSRSSSKVNTVVDEKGHTPSKSLWVGNIPSRTTSTELRFLFNKFGTILSTKIMAKYAFVNFETIESAVVAFKKCHDRDVFNTGCSTINVRFTGSQAESRKAKDDVRERRCSMTVKAQAAHKQYFQPIDAASSNAFSSSPSSEWPNGMPPTGPKSQRQNISPPPLRRGDTYRPSCSARPVRSPSSSDRRWSDDEERRRERSYRRLSDCHYSPAYSSSGSRSTYRSWSRGTQRSRRVSQTRRRESLSSRDPEENLRQRSQSLTKENTAINNHIHSEEAGPNASVDEKGPGSKIVTADLNDTETVADRQTRCLLDAYSNPIEDEDISPVTLSHHLENVWNLADEPRGTTTFLVPQLKQRSKSPSIWPIERLRIENGSTRGSSASSDVATTSSRESSRKRKCHDCKKPENDLAPFTPCSRCTRNFHSGCGDPKPSCCTDKSKFVCGRCQRKPRQLLPSTITENVTAMKAHPHVHCESNADAVPSVHSGNGSTPQVVNCPPDENVLHPRLSEQKLKSFFESRLSTVDAKMNVSFDELPSPDGSRTGPGMSNNTQFAHQKSGLQTPVSTSTIRPSYDNPLGRKYKVVTCKWWASGSCTQTEARCYYAHDHTGIIFPDRKKMNKSWTCYDWMNGRCTSLERDCLHSHKDTGLHTWKDGKPSFKHVTCFWWSKGRCKWDEEFCKFAHEDTGLYSLDPSEIWQGGLKFSTTHPGELNFRVAAGSHGMSPASVSGIHQSTTITSCSSDNLVGPNTAGVQRNAITTSGIKPLLTIDTCTDLSLSHGHHTYPARRPYSTFIGVPPQTPNEDSPDKHHSPGFHDSSKNYSLTERFSDLPTPGTDENAEPEYEPSEHIDLLNEHSPSTAQDQASSAQLGQVLNTTNTVLCDTPLRNHDSGLTERAESTGITAMSRDPRLHRQDRTTDDSPKNSLCEDPLESAKPESTPRLSIRDDMARPGVKKCQRCHKQVFGTDFCRICSTDAGAPHDKTSSDHPSEPSHAATRVQTEDTEVVILSAMSARESEVVSRGPAPQLQIIPKTSLKRGASTNGMFLKTKRPKISLVCTNSNVRPNTIRRGSFDKRSQIGSIGAITQREPKQTLNELIQQERAKNKKRALSSLEGVATQPVADSRAQPCEKLEHVECDSLTRQTAQNRADDSKRPKLDQHCHGKTKPTSQDRHDSLSRSSIERPVRRSSVYSITSNVPEIQSRSPSERSPRSPKCLSHEIDDWGPTELPGVRSKDLRASENVERYQAEHMSSRHVSINQQKTPSPTDEQQNTTPPVVHLHNAVGNTKTFTWASPITCTRCQKGHKKCLHDDDGALSAVKCREYVLSRRGKPDTGRPRNEWDAILRASELDPDSDEDSVRSQMSDDDSEFASETECFPDQSEHDLLTAINDEEMTIEHGSCQEALLGECQKPAIRIVLPALKTLPAGETTDILGPEHNPPLSADNVPKLPRLKGEILFESESEDDDYLSDDCAPPMRKERPIDPLYIRPRWSTDLFEIAPELDHANTLRDIDASRALNPRPSRKEQWATLRDRQLQERRERFGNPHWEVNRLQADVIVTAMVERIVPPRNTDDRFAVGSVETREEEVGFREFLGAPKLPELCLMNDGERLGFQDGQKERDRTFGRTGRGLGRPITDDEKWPVRMR